MQRSIFALGLTAALFVSALAHAESVKKVEVNYSDLNLSLTEDARVLYTRIQEAAYRVCDIEVVNTQGLMLQRKCMAKAVGDAVRSIGNPNLTAVYLSRTPRRELVASSR